MSPSLYIYIKKESGDEKELYPPGNKNLCRNNHFHMFNDVEFINREWICDGLVILARDIIDSVSGKEYTQLSDTHDAIGIFLFILENIDEDRVIGASYS
jgi:hypothetical protein